MAIEDQKTIGLAWSARFGYGVGDFGLNLFWSTLELYLLFYYTDIIGLPNATAGLIFLFAMIWDGVTDPLMGLLADRRQARGLGKYRPFIRYGSVPLAASFIVLFYQPGFQGMALLVYVFGAHVLFRTAYTVVSIPYSSLSARMTSSSAERNLLAASRMVFAATGGLLVAVMTPKLAAALGQGDQVSGFFAVGILYAALSVLILNVSVQFSPENSDIAAADVEKADPSTTPLSLAQIWLSLRSNWPFWIVLGAMLMAQMGGVFMSKTLVYFMKYNVGREDMMGAVLGAMIASVTVCIPFWSWVTSKTNKRTVWIAGGLISMIVYLCIYSLPITGAGALSIIFLLLVINGLGRAASVLTIWSMLGDTVEYGHFKSGQRSEAANFGLVSLAQKVAVGVAAALLGFALDWVGFVSNQQQSAETLHGLKILMTLVPFGFVASSCVLIAFYPITTSLHQRLVAALSWQARR